MAIGTVAFAIMTGPIAAQVPAPGAQSPASPGAPPPASPTAQRPASASPQVNSAEQVTVSGCIQREADYRRSTGAGRGGAVGTGAGVGNEFILANAMMSPASGSAAGAATGTAGTTSNTAFELTGPNEGQAATHVGKHVEIIGKMKASATPGGPTASVPGSQDLKLREIEVSSIRESAGVCTPSS